MHQNEARPLLVALPSFRSLSNTAATELSIPKTSGSIKTTVLEQHGQRGRCAEGREEATEEAT